MITVMGISWVVIMITVIGNEACNNDNRDRE